MALTVGSRLGHYDVTALIGEGGMGQVYQATDTKLNRQVALKILPEAFAEDPDRLARFQREAQVLASLNHPNIAAIHGLEDSEGTKALVLELVEGPTLADRIAKGPIPLDEALPIAKQIAEALEAAHEAGVIHRDLKPANIKVRDDWTVKVLDFGLAKAFQPDASDVSASMSPTISLTAAATQMGMVIGTAAYMAPEQAKGLPVDKRADIWAFGAVLFEMLTGRKLFEAGDVSEMLASVLVKDPDISSIGNHVPGHVRSLVRRCLAKDPRRRMRDIGDVRLAMEGPSETTASAPSDLGVAPTLPVWQRPVTIAVIVLASLAVGGFAVWSLTRPAPLRLTRLPISTSPPPSLSDGGTPDVVVSPDGTRIVYLASGPAGGPLHVRTLDQLDAVLLRGADTNVINPFISPDGNWVGYWSIEDVTLKKVSIHGGPPFTLARAVPGTAGASWGPDDTIIFATRFADFEDRRGLFRVSAAGGEPEPLTMLEEGETGHRWPHILPGGQSVLFTVVKGEGSGNMEIAALRLDTGERTLLVPGGSNPHYAPTGHLVYGVAGTLMAVPFDSNRLAVKGDPVSVLEGVVTEATGAAHFSFASDGSLVYLSGGAREGDERTLVWVDRQGNEVPLAVPEARSYDTPRLSPDGRRLAVTVGELAIGASDVWVSDLALGTLRRLTTNPGRDFDPLWTTDGERMVFASRREGGYGLSSMAWDGTGDAERLVTIEGTQALRPYGWSLDGAVLFEFFSAATTRYDIGILPLDGDGTWEPLLDTVANERAPAISPDGQWIAYASDRTDTDEIYVQRFPELGGEQLISQGGGDYPLWSQDGRELFYWNKETGLIVVPVEPGPNLRVGVAETLFDVGTYFGAGFSRPWDVSPDGQHLLMIKQSSATTDDQLEIILVENWFEELKRLVPVS